MNHGSAVKWTLLAGCLFVSSVSCIPKPQSAASTSSAYLYVAAGTCYSGTGNTTPTNTTASNLVYRINTSTGQRETLIADYKASPANTGDSPVGIANIDANYLYVLVENSTTASLRRIEKVAKTDHGARTIFSNNIAALSSQLRYLQATASGDLLVSKGAGIEYITSSNVRIGSPYINPNGTNCSGFNTLDSKFMLLNTTGTLEFLSAGTSPANRAAGMVLASTNVNCATNVAAPATTAYPSAMAYDAANSKLIVAYAGNSVATAGINSIQVYSVNPATGAISGTAQTIYDANAYPGTYPYLLYGISEMVLDAGTNTLYVATSINTSTTTTNYAIEKFTYDPTQLGTANSKVLTRVGNSPFYPYGSDTNCISQMMLSN